MTLPQSSSAFAKDCLAGRLVLITGGSGALGAVMIEQLAAHGAQVVNADPAPPATPLPGAFIACDSTKEAEVVALFDRIEKDFGRAPDCVLVHAGKVHTHPLDELPLEVWQSVIDLNLTAAFLISREAARRMKAARAGGPTRKIVFTSSWIQQVPWPEIGAYNASKGGLLMLARTLAREVAPHGIRVNAMAPGIVNAGMAKVQWETEPAWRARAEKAIPLGALQETQSVADATVFLCSSASDYMTGSTLLVDGGCSLYPMI
jgi:NAD(P)-dependent dehydrogenase (short-subunit alcohol dehydrogenase family)